MSRLRLQLWDSVIADCEQCLRLSPDNMKAHYYLSQALLAQQDYEGALEHGLTAHRLCAQSGDKSLAVITAHVLRCKKERWEAKEKSRRREEGDLEAELVRLMEMERADALGQIDSDVARREIEAEWEGKIASMHKIFDKARTAADKDRVVPDWAIDDISFGIMVDPVITKTGKSYERASIMEHLARHQTDPLTRDALFPSDLRPNLSLKQACAEFLEANGWAVDW
jgi:STIP1 homology and U-box containing protein 1